MEIGIAQLATLLTAAGVAIYVLGLVGLALSINLTFTEKWATAWYAGSLMPRTVVAGQGLRIWRQGLFRIVSLVFALLLLSATYAATRYFVRYILDTLGLSSTFGIATGIATLIGALAVSHFVPGIMIRRNRWLARVRSKLEADGNAPQYRRLSLVTAASLWFIGIGMSISGGYLVFKGLRFNSDDGSVNWDIITVAFLVFLVGAFFVAIPSADRIEHPLPSVTLIGAGEGTPKLVGWLIAHSDGYWHLFDSQHVLLSVPDERVIEARVDDPGGIAQDGETEGRPP